MSDKFIFFIIFIFGFVLPHLLGYIYYIRCKKYKEENIKREKAYEEFMEKEIHNMASCIYKITQWRKKK